MDASDNLTGLRRTLLAGGASQTTPGSLSRQRSLLAGGASQTTPGSLSRQQKLSLPATAAGSLPSLYDPLGGLALSNLNYSHSVDISF